MQLLTPREYVKVDVANSFGLDKKTWDERINWFDENQHQLESLQKQADEPALYYAGVNAWRNIQKGNINYYPIGLDATSSGIQYLSILSGCEKSASICNLINNGKRNDAYTIVYKKQIERLNQEAKISREDTKAALMRCLYGSKATPKKVFGEGTELLKAFYDTVKEELPGAWELNQAFLSLWDNTVTKYSWVLPDNFHAGFKVMKECKERVMFLNRPYNVKYYKNAPVDDGRALSANQIHSVDGLTVREVTTRAAYSQKETFMNLFLWFKENKNQGKDALKDSHLRSVLQHYHDSGFLSARVLDLIDQTNAGILNQEEQEAVLHLCKTLPNKSFQVISIHDKYLCLPNYGNDLRKLYNQVLYEIAKSNLLQFLVNQIYPKGVRVTKNSDFADKILDAEYALS